MFARIGSIAVIAFVSIAALAACSGDDKTSSSTSSSGGSSSGGSSSGGSSTSSSSTSSSSGGSECTDIKQCPELTCVCGGFSGAKVQKCTNGVCAKSCSEAGCS